MKNSSQEVSENYNVKVDKELLYEFLLTDEEMLGVVHLKEVYKVIDICLKKYASSYFNEFSELKSEVFLKILERKVRFNPGLDAYNYIYTISRNEIGNCIYRWKKESRIEDQGSKVKNGTYQPSFEDDLQIPSCCHKYLPYLTCEADFVSKRVARKDVVDLISWLLLKEQKKKDPIPEFLTTEKQSVNVLYRLLKDIVNQF